MKCILILFEYQQTLLLLKKLFQKKSLKNGRSETSRVNILRSELLSIQLQREIFEK